ncbi:hypothetical protein L2E82_48443 [Cichorium intybus]|uniref:Uncharacterized protein n=1 Tax=Cichorium intybus TaxID=13427 RepID=A0ACB8YYE3_CICIN|nr:hypothetical protein L2E82_48443 [Cichorium intybus]
MKGSILIQSPCTDPKKLRVKEKPGLEVVGNWNRKSKLLEGVDLSIGKFPVLHLQMKLRVESRKHLPMDYCLFLFLDLILFFNFPAQLYVIPKYEGGDLLLTYVDIGIPPNNKGKHSIGCLFWLLARMVLQMRGVINQGHKWWIYFSTEPEEVKEQEEEVALTTDYPDYGGGALGGIGDQWSAQIPDAQWAPDMPPPIAAAPVAGSGWTGDTPVAGAEGWEAMAAPLAAPVEGVAASGWE